MLLSTTTPRPDGSRPRIPWLYVLVASLTPPDEGYWAPIVLTSGQVEVSCEDIQYQRRECITACVGVPSASRAASTPAAAPRTFGYSSATVGEAETNATEV